MASLDAAIQKNISALKSAAEKRQSAVAAIAASPPPPALPVMQDLYSIDVLARGGVYHDSKGIGFHSTGLIFFASNFGDEVLGVNQFTGDIVTKWGAEDGVSGPVDLLIAPDDMIYWTEGFTGRVVKARMGGPVETLAELGPITKGIALSLDASILYVATKEFSDALWKIDLVNGGQEQVPIEGLGNLNGMDVGPDGLYATRQTLPEVVRIDPETATLEVVSADFQVPYDLKFDTDFNMYVLDIATREMFLVDRQTGEKKSARVMAAGEEHFAIDRSNNLYISNTMSGGLKRINNSGGEVNIGRPGGMIAPGGLTINSACGGSRVWVADQWSLREFDRETGAPGLVVGFDPAAEIPIAPSSVAPSGDYLAMASWPYGLVNIWDPATGKLVETFSDLTLPVNAIAIGDRLAIAEFGTGSVVWADSRDPIVTGLTGPAGLAYDGTTLFVGDTLAGTITRIEGGPAGWRAPAIFASGLMGPEGLAINTNGDVLVVETWIQRLTNLSRADGAINAVQHLSGIGIPAPPGLPPTGWSLSSVFVEPDGTLLVSGDRARVLYRFVPKPPAGQKQKVPASNFRLHS